MALTVNGERLSPSQVDAEVARLRAGQGQDPRLRDVAPTDLVHLARYNLVNRVLLAQEARRRVPTVEPREVKARYKALAVRAGSPAALAKAHGRAPADVERFKRELAADLRLEKLFQRLAADLPPPTDKDLFDAYMRQPDRWQLPEAVHAQHVLKRRQPGLAADSARQTLSAVRAQALAGADFVGLARQFSDCPEQTDLGFVSRGQLVPAFEAAAFALEPGQVSDVFETEFGWHLAKVVARRAAALQPFDTVKARMQALWQQEQQRAAIEGLLQRLRAAATIHDA